MVSLPPAATTTDQWVVAKTGERGSASPEPVVPELAVGFEALTSGENS
ncbi:hypothetical protein SBV1_740034 [Verrucomicrobia bacterium]|nr:hypothetical protein SBV1_740034 [Verrucomicrobiota bacterium]